MLTVGDRFPSLDPAAVYGVELPALCRVRSEDFAGQCLVAYFWSRDSTSVCPTDFAKFGRSQPDFAEGSARIIELGVDNEYVHLVWRQQRPGPAVQTGGLTSCEWPRGEPTLVAG